MAKQESLSECEIKIWGSVQHIFMSPQAAVSCLRLKPNFCCSRHRHHQRANTFALQKGRIAIEEWESKPVGRGTITVLNPGATHSVPSMTWHRFRVISASEMSEFYWPDTGGIVSIDDIERYDVGGPDDLNDIRDIIC